MSVEFFLEICHEGHIVAEAKTHMIHIVILLEPADSAELFTDVVLVGWITKIIFLTNKHTDWYVLDLLKDDQWNNSTSVVCDIGFVGTIIKLFKHSSICDLTVVNNLLGGAAGTTSGIHDVGSFDVIVCILVQMEPFTDTITDA